MAPQGGEPRVGARGGTHVAQGATGPEEVQRVQSDGLLLLDDRGGHGGLQVLVRQRARLALALVHHQQHHQPEEAPECRGDTNLVTKYQVN